MIFVSILVALLTAHVVFVASTVIKTYLAHEKLKKQSRGLKSCPNFSPLIGHIKSYVFRPNLSLEVKGLHEQCGKTFLVMMGRQPMCSTLDLDLISHIAISESHLHTFRMYVDLPIREMIVDNLITTRNWRPIRKALAMALRPNRFKTPNVTRELENSINKLIETIERKLEVAEKQQKAITLNADDYFHRYSLDLVLNCFYKQDKLVDFKAKEDQMVKMIDGGLNAVFSNPFVAYIIVFNYLNPLIDWFILHLTKLGSWRKQVMEFIRRQTKLNLEARKELKRQTLEGTTTMTQNENITLRDGSTFNRNMIDSFIDEYLAGKLTTSQYLHSSFFLFAAADKTAADGLTSVLYYLALNKDKQEKLRQEIRLNGLESEYLMWTINESLRLSPPAPIGCSRRVERDIEIEGGRFVVPSGTCVLTPLYAIHRLKEYWGDDADEFKPERFAQQKSFHPCQFMPFGAGSRRCPGKEFALHEMRLVLVELLTRYRFSGRPKKDEGFDSPFYIFLIPYEHVILEISRV